MRMSLGSGDRFILSPLIKDVFLTTLKAIRKGLQN